MASALIELLVKIQLLDERQHDAVMSRAKSGTGGHIVQEIAELGYATESTVARALSVELGLPRIDLGMTPPEGQAVALLDARTCAERFVLPVALRENGELLWLAMADPTDQDTIGVVRRRSQKRVRPAVAGPTEILRAVRTLYAAPGAGQQRPEQAAPEQLKAIELQGEAADEPFEVVNVADDISGSPLSRLAQQLGVEVPSNMPSQQLRRDGAAVAKRPPSVQAAAAAARPIELSPAPPIVPEVSTPARGPMIPPQTDPRIRAIRALDFDELLSPATKGGAISADDLTSADDLASLEALRTSLEKGALILRALAELCVEKGLFTREEMKRRNRS